MLIDADMISAERRDGGTGLALATHVPVLFLAHHIGIFCLCSCLNGECVWRMCVEKVFGWD